MSKLVKKAECLAKKLDKAADADLSEKKLEDLRLARAKIFNVIALLKRVFS